MVLLVDFGGVDQEGRLRHRKELLKVRRDIEHGRVPTILMTLPNGTSIMKSPIAWDGASFDALLHKDDD